MYFIFLTRFIVKIVVRECNPTFLCVILKIGMHLQLGALTMYCIVTGCAISNVNFTYLPNGEPEGKAYVEFSSDYDLQRALDRNDCTVGARDVVGMLKQLFLKLG